MMKERYLEVPVVEDLREKMVFVGGPRQVGKTTLCRAMVARHFKSHAYFNWDNRSDRRAIAAADWPAKAELLIFDEIHKHRPWKRWIKGEYDQLKETYRFLVTGSARLDVYRRGGDSLQGRYHYYRLHPFTLAELEGLSPRIAVGDRLVFDTRPRGAALRTLMAYGGFPEPVTRQDARHLRRWQNEKIERMFREDIRDIEAVRDIGNMKLLSDMLPGRVGSLLSINSIREDLDVSFRAAAHWLDVLEAFYYQFRVYPYMSRAFRALKKEPKLYLWDWSEVPSDAARFENLIGSHLLKFVHFVTDTEGYKVGLHFLRDLEKREVDYLVTLAGRPWFAVEVKLTETEPSPHLIRFKNKLGIPNAYQVVKRDGISVVKDGIHILSAAEFLTGLV